MCKCDVAYAPNPSGTYMVWGTICPQHIREFYEFMETLYIDGDNNAQR